MCPCKYCFGCILHILVVVQNILSFFFLWFVKLFLKFLFWLQRCLEVCLWPLKLLQVFCPLPVLPSQPPIISCPLCDTCRLQTSIPLTTDVAALAPALFIRIFLLPSFPVIFFCFLSTTYGFQWPLTPYHLFPFLFLFLVLDPGFVIRISRMMLLLIL